MKKVALARFLVPKVAEEKGDQGRFLTGSCTRPREPCPL